MKTDKYKNKMTVIVDLIGTLLREITDYDEKAQVLKLDKAFI